VVVVADDVDDDDDVLRVLFAEEGDCAGEVVLEGDGDLKGVP
jgi:hypothetical protein